MQINPISTLVFVCGALLALITSYAWWHRSTRGSFIFSLFMASMTVYVWGYSLELSSLNLQTMLFWSKVEYLGIYTFPTLFFIFVLEYTGRDRWLTRRNLFLLFLFPTLLLIFKLTDDRFHLVYSSAWVDMSGQIPLLGFTRGPVYMLAFYAFIPVCWGIILLWQKRDNTPLLYRTQVTLLAAGVFPPLVVFIAYMTGVRPFPNLRYLDLNAFMYTFWGLTISWAAFRYRLFDLAPIAREALIENLSDGVLVLDDLGRIVDANPVGMKILGLTQLPIGQPASQVLSTWENLRDIRQFSDTAAPGSPLKVEIEHTIGDESQYFDVNVTVLQDKTKRTIGQLILIHDITGRKQLEKKFRELSLEDELTGLSNRRGFSVLADQFIHMATRMNLKAALIFADLDEMKKINDTFGHVEGDQALVDTTQLIRSATRSSDILARMGGDEFVILAFETQANLAEVMLDRLQRQIETFNLQEDRKYPISVSFGVAYFDPDKPIPLNDLVKEADKAMYAQKLAKKNI